MHGCAIGEGCQRSKNRNGPVHLPRNMGRTRPPARAGRSGATRGGHVLGELALGLLAHRLEVGNGAIARADAVLRRRLPERQRGERRQECDEREHADHAAPSRVLLQSAER
eukprot:7215743-Prymnesium_polylepis.1